MDAEHRLQHWFSKLAPLSILLPPLAVLLFAWMLREMPDRQALGRRSILVAFDPIAIETARESPLRVAGAWRLSSDDPDFGGISGLAVDGDSLLALSDSGRLTRLPKPPGGTRAATIGDLPGGPGRPLQKRDRDSEALLADPGGRGWWTAFEWHHQLWLYDSRLERSLGKVALPANGWSENAGIEGMVADGDDLLMFRETGGTAIRFGGGEAAALPVDRLEARISDAATLPGGNILLIERRLTWRGFVNALVLLAPDGRGYRVARRAPLPLGPLDNAEALAVEPLPGGGIRLWLMTDDNFQRPLRTVLVAFDLNSQDWIGT